VRYAAQRGLRIAPQSTGHNAGPIDGLEESLVRTDALQEIRIDVAARRARVRSGVRWGAVSDLASEAGLAPLSGSSRDVGVAGYSLGGGLGWLGRKHGLQTNALTAVEMVTADGELRRIDHDHETDLFWAVRGGGDNFGVVTALEFELFEVPELYAGAFFFPYERSSEIMHAWHELVSAGLPDEITTVGRVVQVPPLEEIPEIIRGKSFAIVQAAFLGNERDGAELLRPLAELGPEMNTFGMVGPNALGYLAMDPDSPLPYAGSSRVVSDVSAAGIDAFVATAGPGSGSTLASVELRSLGGALARRAPGHGALATLDGDYLMFAVGRVFSPRDARRGGRPGRGDLRGARVLGIRHAPPQLRGGQGRRAPVVRRGHMADAARPAHALGPEGRVPRQPPDQGLVGMGRLLPCSPSLSVAAAHSPAAIGGVRR
jgi:FAD binding domain